MEQSTDTNIVPIPKSKYSNVGQILDATVSEFNDPNLKDSLTFLEQLEEIKATLEWSESNCRQIYVSCHRQDRDILREAISQVFTKCCLDLRLPNEYSLSGGIFDIVVKLLSQNKQELTGEAFVTVYVHGFTKIATRTKQNSAQPFTHLYNQQTEENKKFLEYPKVLIITLIDDSSGLTKQREISDYAMRSDFAPTITIPHL